MVKNVMKVQILNFFDNVVLSSNNTAPYLE